MEPDNLFRSPMDLISLCVCVCVCARARARARVHRVCYSAQWNYGHVFGTTSLANCRMCSKRKCVSHLVTHITIYQVRKCLNSVTGPVLLLSLDLKFVKIANKNTDFARTSNMRFRDSHSTRYQLQSIIMDTREMTFIYFTYLAKAIVTNLRLRQLFSTLVRRWEHNLS
jgi:hypothetical protein